jgi:hypothetical protein
MRSSLIAGCRASNAIVTARARWRESSMAFSDMLRTRLAPPRRQGGALKVDEHAVIDMTAQ